LGIVLFLLQESRQGLHFQGTDLWRSKKGKAGCGVLAKEMLADG
jgi:hypothetical protein